MMREIKFRAWDTKNSKWLDLDYMDGKTLGLRPNGTLFMHVDYYGCGDESCCSGGTYDDDLTDVILEQYTGLKDKNGKEIYEGDIMSIDGQICGWVEFYTDLGSYIVANRCDGEDVYSMIYRRGLEVVGTIHENPELLK